MITYGSLPEDDQSTAERTFAFVSFLGNLLVLGPLYAASFALGLVLWLRTAAAMLWPEFFKPSLSYVAIAFIASGIFFLGEHVLKDRPWLWFWLGFVVLIVYGLIALSLGLVPL